MSKRVKEAAKCVSVLFFLIAVLNSLSGLFDLIKEFSILGFFISILYVKYGLKFFFPLLLKHILTYLSKQSFWDPREASEEVVTLTSRQHGIKIGCGSWPQIYLGLNPSANAARLTLVHRVTQVFQTCTGFIACERNVTILCM